MQKHKLFKRGVKVYSSVMENHFFTILCVSRQHTETDFHWYHKIFRGSSVMNGSMNQQR